MASVLDVVPYEKFIRLQLLLGEPFAHIAEVARSSGVPSVSLPKLSKLKSELMDSLPSELQARALESGFDDQIIRECSVLPSELHWPETDTLKLFFSYNDEFQSALEYFAASELRIRIESLLLTGLCSPDEISKALSNWSKYRMTPEAVRLFSYYFCNTEVMRCFSNWKSYIEALESRDHRWFLGRAYDAQTRGDLIVLLDDLSIRSAITVIPEDTVRDLMMTAFVQFKKEERKLAEGVPAKSTSIFDWASMYCSMFDRVQKVIENVDQGNALDTVRTKLQTIKQSKVKLLKDYTLAAKEA